MSVDKSLEDAQQVFADNNQNNSINWDELAERARYDEILLAKLIHIYEEDNLKRIDEICELLKKSDFMRIKDIAHTIKGSSMNMAVKSVADLSRRMEIEAQKHNLTFLSVSVVDLKHAIVDSVKHLKSNLEMGFLSNSHACVCLAETAERSGN